MSWKIFELLSRSENTFREYVLYLKQIAKTEPSYAYNVMFILDIHDVTFIRKHPKKIGRLPPVLLFKIQNWWNFPVFLGCFRTKDYVMNIKNLEDLSCFQTIDEAWNFLNDSLLHRQWIILSLLNPTTKNSFLFVQIMWYFVIRRALTSSFFETIHIQIFISQGIFFAQV